MKINSNTKLVLKDIYLYDIESCHYSIMQRLGLDLSGVNKEDKLERNTQIGKMMQKNPKLTSLLRTTTKSIIDEYIRVNKLLDSEILLRQYDGIITTRTLRVSDLGGIQLNLRKTFVNFILSISRNSYIALDTEMKTTIKGVPFRYEEMDKFYSLICQIVNSENKESIFRRLQDLKDNIMTNQNAKMFGIPIGNNKFHIFLKEYGQVEVVGQTLKIMDANDIDREKYFNFYISPFTKSIVVEYVRC